MTTAMTSVFELFKIGIGPSSSHTVGPMVAARRFCLELEALGEPADVTRLTADLYGSLALTGIGHRTDRAIVAGWHGEEPESVAPDALDRLYEQVQHDRALSWLGRHRIAMDLERDLLWHRDEFLPQHSNAVRFTAYSGPAPRLVRTYFSIGGGFVAEESELATGQDATGAIQSPRFPFRSAAELLDLCHRHQLTMAQIVRANERTLRSEAQIDAGLDRIWHTMRECIRRGCHTVGVLPGGLGVQRRAPELYRRLGDHPSGPARSDPLTAMDWVDMCALAVNEENAAGGRVVTAPDQRRRWHHTGRTELLRTLRPHRSAGGHPRVFTDGHRHRHVVQEKRLTVGSRDGLSG
ncbi:MAG: hypothetical protein KatS3mg111_0637 [Pirellulaceae bacterium]|nr:MAG: hypothetical protein KatS3mg111_0637 [Pirellulaceae bacterium]